MFTLALVLCSDAGSSFVEPVLKLTVQSRLRQVAPNEDVAPNESRPLEALCGQEMKVSR